MEEINKRLIVENQNLKENVKKSLMLITNLFENCRRSEVSAMLKGEESENEIDKEDIVQKLLVIRKAINENYCKKTKAMKTRPLKENNPSRLPMLHNL